MHHPCTRSITMINTEFLKFRFSGLKQKTLSRSLGSRPNQQMASAVQLRPQSTEKRRPWQTLNHNSCPFLFVSGRLYRPLRSSLKVWVTQHSTIFYGNITETINCTWITLLNSPKSRSFPNSVSHIRKLNLHAASKIIIHIMITADGLYMFCSYTGFRC